LVHSGTTELEANRDFRAAFGRCIIGLPLSVCGEAAMSVLHWLASYWVEILAALLLVALIFHLWRKRNNRSNER
jgi:uncharacterized membrane protein YfcA